MDIWEDAKYTFAVFAVFIFISNLGLVESLWKNWYHEINHSTFSA